MTRAVRCSAETSEIDRDRVHAWLRDSYWASDRSRERQEAAIDASRNYGAYDAETGEQLAYARIITDGATFAWLCDVIVDPAARGDGIGHRLMACVMADLEPLGIAKMMLNTADAHGVYERFGFSGIDRPEMLMARLSG